MSIERSDQSSPAAAGYARNLQALAGPSGRFRWKRAVIEQDWKGRAFLHSRFEFPLPENPTDQA